MSESQNQLSLQKKFSPNSICFGCGPANPKGLHVASFPTPDGKRVLARFKPAPHHQAFPGIVNGGIIGALLDCHCNWTAAHHLMLQSGADTPPCTVTADYTITLKRPTPTDVELELEAWVVEPQPDGAGANPNSDRAIVEGVLKANGKVCATCKGTFVAVKPGHPAFHRW